MQTEKMKRIGIKIYPRQNIRTANMDQSNNGFQLSTSRESGHSIYQDFLDSLPFLRRT